jgi:hypothetical protein
MIYESEKNQKNDKKSVKNSLIIKRSKTYKGKLIKRISNANKRSVNKMSKFIIRNKEK